MSTWLDDAEFQARARDAESELMAPELQRCPVCHGRGEVRWNPSRDGDPQFVESAECRTCDGQGAIEDDGEFTHEDNQTPADAMPPAPAGMASSPAGGRTPGRTPASRPPASSTSSSSAPPATGLKDAAGISERPAPAASPDTDAPAVRAPCGGTPPRSQAARSSLPPNDGDRTLKTHRPRRIPHKSDAAARTNGA